MYKCFLIAICVLISACGSSQTPTQKEKNVIEKITDWQEREQAVEDITEIIDGLTDYNQLLQRLTEIVYNEHAFIKYKPDSIDYWKTSYETLIDGFGDCEDIAAYYYAIIRNEKLLPDSNVFIRIVQWEETKTYHAFVVIVTDESEIFIDNGLIMTMQAKPHKITIEYDLFSIFN